MTHVATCAVIRVLRHVGIRFACSKARVRMGLSHWQLRALLLPKLQVGARVKLRVRVRFRVTIRVRVKVSKVRLRLRLVNGRVRNEIEARIIYNSCKTETII